MVRHRLWEPKSLFGILEISIDKFVGLNGEDYWSREGSNLVIIYSLLVLPRDWRF